MYKILKNFSISVCVHEVIVIQYFRNSWIIQELQIKIMCLFKMITMERLMDPHQPRRKYRAPHNSLQERFVKDESELFRKCKNIVGQGKLIINQAKWVLFLYPAPLYYNTLSIFSWLTAFTGYTPSGFWQNVMANICHWTYIKCRNMTFCQ